MSRSQRGHIYEVIGAFQVRFYETELRDEQLSRVQGVHVRSHTVSCAKDRKHYSAKSKLRQLLCDNFMRKVNTATATEQDMTVVSFWEKRYLPYSKRSSS